MMEATAANLRALRREHRLSQMELAGLVHLSGAARISDWERGVHPIDPARWELLLIKLHRHTVFIPR
jgi:DNA-binding transcriptional regulator YiaG